MPTLLKPCQLEGRPIGALYRQEELENSPLLHSARRDFVRAINEMTEFARLAHENGLGIEEARALLMLGRFYRRIGQDREAEHAWRQVILLQEHFWHTLGPDDRLKVSSGETFEALCLGQLSLLVLQGRNEEALELSEHLRAQAFAELLRGRSVPAAAGESRRLSVCRNQSFCRRVPVNDCRIHGGCEF